MAHTLPPFPYAYDALEPHFNAQTLQIHHDRYHRGYVERLNAALAGTAWEHAPIEVTLRNLEALPREKQTTVRNMGGGHLNHSLFWESLRPPGYRGPDGPFTDAVNGRFGSLANFKEALFNVAGRDLFGAGWAWLVHDGTGLEVMLTANQDNPVMIGRTPILGIDMWEHAYFPHYLSRKDYFDAWWQLVNWGTVGARLAAIGTPDNFGVRS